MQKITVPHVLQLLIEYFETGIKETDTVAKAIVESDSANKEKWQQEIELYRDEGKWTGVRAIEAEMLAHALRDMATAINTE